MSIDNGHFPLPDLLRRELQQNFKSKYKFSRGTSWQFFWQDWSRELDTDPPSAPTVRKLIDSERQKFYKYRILDGCCRLLLDCSYNDWMAGYRNVPEVPLPPKNKTAKNLPEPSSSSFGDRGRIDNPRKKLVAPTGLLAGSPAPRDWCGNPFGDRGRIEDPSRFFDRQDLLHQIFEELGKGSSISLVGESQIGKSSILAMVCKKGQGQIQPRPDGFIDLDLQCIRNEDDFFKALCDRLAIPNCRGYDLASALEGKRYILCLDEMEKMRNSSRFSDEIRAELKGLADGAKRPLKLVFASRSPLEEIFPDSPEMTSPLSGIYRCLKVPPFSEEVARAFLQHRLQGTGTTFSEVQITDLLAESKGNPARLQSAAADLYRRIADPT